MSGGGGGIISTRLAPLGQLLTEKINVKSKGSKKIHIKKLSHTLDVCFAKIEIFTLNV